MCLEVLEEFAGRIAAAAIDEAQRTVGESDAVARIDGVEQFALSFGEFLVGLGDYRLMVPDRVVVDALVETLEVKIGKRRKRLRTSDKKHDGRHDTVITVRRRAQSPARLSSFSAPKSAQVAGVAAAIRPASHPRIARLRVSPQ